MSLMAGADPGVSAFPDGDSLFSWAGLKQAAMLNPKKPISDGAAQSEPMSLMTAADPSMRDPLRRVGLKQAATLTPKPCPSWAQSEPTPPVAGANVHRTMRDGLSRQAMPSPKTLSMAPQSELMSLMAGADPGVSAFPDGDSLFSLGGDHPGAGGHRLRRPRTTSSQAQVPHRRAAPPRPSRMRCEGAVDRHARPG